MKKNIEPQAVDGEASELADATQFDILSKKIISKFFRHSLFTRLAITDWEGIITGQGDMVRMVDHTEIIAQYAIPIEEERKPGIFNDIVTIDLVSKRIAMDLKAKVEEHIIDTDDALMTSYIAAAIMEMSPEKYVQGRLYFVAGMVKSGGFDPKGYGMKFVYGFKIG